jgi:hypothetical protein
MKCCEQDPMYLFMAYLMILSVAQTTYYKMVRSCVTAYIGGFMLNVLQQRYRSKVGH